MKILNEERIDTFLFYHGRDMLTLKTSRFENYCAEQDGSGYTEKPSTLKKYISGQAYKPDSVPLYEYKGDNHFSGPDITVRL